MKTVLYIALGPVQEFIERARRTRDLWFGSHLLSEVSRAVARSLAEAGWELIFPALKRGDDELAICMSTRRASGGVPLGIVNKVVAIHGQLDDAAVEAHADAGRRAGILAWGAFAEQARRHAPSLLDRDLQDHEKPEVVIESLLEFYAAWKPFGDDSDFASALKCAEDAVDARKHLRDFRGWVGGRFNKSSLDGQRESVLRDRQPDGDYDRDRGAARRLRLAKSEHLDGIGFVKRAGGRADQFIPVARVAVQPWMEAVGLRARSDGPLAHALAALDRASESFEVPHCDRSVTSWLAGSPNYDGQILFPGRWESMDEEILGEDREGESWCAHHVGPLYRDHHLPEPWQYVACLRADGDKMGKYLSELQTPDAHQKAANGLAAFASAVRGIVEDNQGVLIYAGGDDVLALLPGRTSLECADALRSAFQDHLREAFNEGGLPTLSVGIAITHYLTPLGEIARLAHDAEKYAKRGDNLPPDDPRERNALGIVVDKRSGDTIKWRRQWTVENQPDHALPHLFVHRIRDHLVEGTLPGGTLTELQQIRMAMDRIPDSAGRETSTGSAYCREIHRVLNRKRPVGMGRLDPGNLGLTLPMVEKASVKSVREALTTWLDAARVAAALADAELNVRRILNPAATAGEAT